MTSLAGGGRLLFRRREMVLNVARMVEVKARPPLIRIAGEFRMPFGKAGELDAMTNLELWFGKMSNVKVFAVMLLVAGRARQIARFHSIHISDSSAG